jgi:hypothetical protein
MSNNRLVWCLNRLKCQTTDWFGVYAEENDQTIDWFGVYTDENVKQ